MLWDRLSENVGGDSIAPLPAALLRSGNVSPRPITKDRAVPLKVDDRDRGQASSIRGIGESFAARPSASGSVKMDRVPRVALLIEGSNAYANGLLKGITDFLKVNDPWSVYLPETAGGETLAERLKHWRGDGVIVRGESADIAAAVSKCACPVVNLSLSSQLPDVPTVHSDVRAEAEMAFAHLRERGFRNLAYCGTSEYIWTGLQFDRFAECASAAGLKTHPLMIPLHLRQPKDWADGQKRLIRWLQLLPKPTGIFACFDLLGQELLTACRQAGIRVPDDVAVIGVDNDPVRCGLSDPPLSSVAPDSRYIGNFAADLLARMMRGEAVNSSPRFVAPLGVVARGSTDALAVRDPDVVKAVDYIRTHACEPISVKSLLDVIPLSRRALESRFIKILGRTPHEQILLCRIERTKQLLHDTDLPIKTIAKLVGTATPEYLSVVFRRLVKLSPSEYRQAHQLTPARTEGASSAARTARRRTHDLSA